VPHTLTIGSGADVSVSSFNAGSATADAVFDNTLEWHGVTAIYDSTANILIPTQYFSLIDEDGFDWAHPATLPEPTSIGLLGLGAMGLLTRRRR